MDMDLNIIPMAMIVPVDVVVDVYVSSNFAAHVNNPGTNSSEFVNNIILKLEPSTSIENVYCQYKQKFKIQLDNQPILYHGLFTKTIVEFDKTLSDFYLPGKCIHISIDFDKKGMFEYYF